MWGGAGLGSGPHCGGTGRLPRLSAGSSIRPWAWPKSSGEGSEPCPISIAGVSRAGSARISGLPSQWNHNPGKSPAGRGLADHPRVVGQVVTEVGFAPVVELPEWTPCRVVGVVDRVGAGGQDLAERKGKNIHEWRVFDEIAVMAQIAKARGEGPTTR